MDLLQTLSPGRQWIALPRRWQAATTSAVALWTPVATGGFGIAQISGTVLAGIDRAVLGPAN